MALFDVAFENLLKNEGDTFTNNPIDHGGPTKFGITLQTYNDMFHTNGDAHVIENLTRETARSIFKTFFWYRLHLDRIGATHPEIALIMFDQAVNRGPFGMVRLVQKSINELLKVRVLQEDGIMGEETLREIERAPKGDLGFQIFKTAQINYVRIVKNNPDQVAFLEGWLRRTHDMIDLLKGGVKL